MGRFKPPMSLSVKRYQIVFIKLYWNINTSGNQTIRTNSKYKKTVLPFGPLMLTVLVSMAWHAFVPEKK